MCLINKRSYWLIGGRYFDLVHLIWVLFGYFQQFLIMSIPESPGEPGGPGGPGLPGGPGIATELEPAAKSSSFSLQIYSQEFTFMFIQCTVAC